MNWIKKIYKAFLGRFVFRPMRSEIRELLSASFSELATRDTEIEARVIKIENRIINYYRYRYDAIDRAADYLVPSQLPGDYMEFGVYQGTLFSYSYKILSPLFPDMRFVAFDSFEGLPKPAGLDAINGYSGGFSEGQFSCTEEEFIKNIGEAGVDQNRVLTIKGWFNQTLTAQKAREYGFKRIAIAYIDCDLYESTVPILTFITPLLSIGTVLMFDDWKNFHNLPDFGQQKACSEWLKENPKITLRELFPFAANGQAFTVSSC